VPHASLDAEKRWHVCTGLGDDHRLDSGVFSQALIKLIMAVDGH
jgi:hypothetical protein